MNIMTTSRERIKQALNHQSSDRIPVDFGSTAVTGIHCRLVEALREYYGLSYKLLLLWILFRCLAKLIVSWRMLWE